LLGILSFISIFAILKVITGKCFICGAENPNAPLFSRYSQFRRDQPAMSCNYIGRCTNSRRDRRRLGFGFRLRCAHV